MKHGLMMYNIGQKLMMEKYKDQKAYSYWMSGFVDTIFVSKCPSNSKFTFLKGNVSLSQKLRDDPHQVWVCVEITNTDCRIVYSWCTCTAGTGVACNHVIALLYKVNYACNKQYISPACTSIPLGWNRGTKKEVTPNRLESLTFCKGKKSKKPSNRDIVLNQSLRKDFDPQKPQDRQLTNGRVSAFLNSIKKNVPSACVLYSVEHGRDDGLPTPLVQRAAEFMSTEEMKNRAMEETVLLFICQSQLTVEQVKRIECETRNQHASDPWRQQQMGRITASYFHVYTKTEAIMKSRRKKTQYSPMVFSMLNEAEDISYLPQIKWRTAHEEDEVKSFMSDIASQHEDGLKGFQKCGLYVKADYPYLAGSPDGLFTCKCCGAATVEIKCPYSVRNENIMEKEVYKRVEFLEEHNGVPRLKGTHKYYTQVQVQMWVCSVNHSFFVVWTAGHRPLYDKIEFDKAYITKVVNTLTLFYKSYTLLCMLGYRDIFLCPKCEKVISEEAEINCVATESSICCDACNTWWHLPCAGLTKHCAESLDSWLCFSCLVENADSHGDESNSTYDSSKEDEQSGASTSKTVLHTNEGTNSICSVCHSKDIPVVPVGGEHVCSVCKNAIHAWCSNHGDITNSAELVCYSCHI